MAVSRQTRQVSLDAESMNRNSWVENSSRLGKFSEEKFAPVSLDRIWRHRIDKNVLEDGPCNFEGRRSLCQREKERERGRTKIGRSQRNRRKGNWGGSDGNLDAKRLDISFQPSGY